MRCGGGAVVVRRCGGDFMPMSRWFGADVVAVVMRRCGGHFMPMSRWFGTFFSTILVLFIVPSSLVQVKSLRQKIRRKGCSAQGALRVMAAARAALLIYKLPPKAAPYGRRRRHSKLRRASGAPYL